MVSQDGCRGLTVVTTSFMMWSTSQVYTLCTQILTQIVWRHCFLCTCSYNVGMTPEKRTQSLWRLAERVKHCETTSTCTQQEASTSSAIKITTTTCSNRRTLPSRKTRKRRHSDSTKISPSARLENFSCFLVYFCLLNQFDFQALCKIILNTKVFYTEYLVYLKWIGS